MKRLQIPDDYLNKSKMLTFKIYVATQRKTKKK